MVPAVAGKVHLRYEKADYSILGHSRITFRGNVSIQPCSDVLVAQQL